MTHSLPFLLTIIGACSSALIPDPHPAPNESSPAVVTQSAPDDPPWMERYTRSTREERPDFTEHTSPALAGALANPDGLWSFLVAPETPYLERLAAARQGAEVLPFEFLPRLVSARGELWREELVHNWGMEFNPMSSVRSPGSLVELPQQARARSILGRAWMVPAERTEFPITWQEECAAPWPWQVRKAIDELYGSLAYRARGESASGWHQAALTMPWRTDEEALRFVEATGSVIHFITLPVLARWRTIGLRAELPEAAARIAASLGELQRLWQDPRSGDLAALLALDILSSSPHERARASAAYSVASMGKTVIEEQTSKWAVRPSSGGVKWPPLPPVANSLLLELGRNGLDPRAGDEWSRLYAYVFSLCECLQTPPIVVDRTYTGPRSAEVPRSLDKFAEWFRAREAGFEAGTAKEQGKWTELRALLEASTQH